MTNLPTDPKTEYLYVTYDERYYFDPDRAAVMESSQTLREAQKSRLDYGNAVIVRYRVENGDLLVDPEIQANE